MRRHNVQKAKRSVSATASTLPWRFFILTVLCACILAAGFFFAARQHFMTMDLGLRNSKMRKQIEDLESERRRLILSKEVSLSPMEITRTAHSMGFREQIEQPQPTVIKDVKPQTENETATPVQTSFRQPDKPQTTTVAEKDSKKLVKQIVQQTAAKQTPAVSKQSAANERPRVVSDVDKRIAQTSTKQASKLR